MTDIKDRVLSDPKAKEEAKNQAWAGFREIMSQARRCEIPVHHAIRVSRDYLDTLKLDYFSALKRLGTTHGEIYQDAFSHFLTEILPNVTEGRSAALRLFQDESELYYNYVDRDETYERAGISRDEVIDQITQKFLHNAQNAMNVYHAWDAIAVMNQFHEDCEVETDAVFERLGVDKASLYGGIAFRETRNARNDEYGPLDRRPSDDFKSSCVYTSVTGTRERLLDICDELAEMIPDIDHPVNRQHMANHILYLAEKLDFKPAELAALNIQLTAQTAKGEIRDTASQFIPDQD